MSDFFQNGIITTLHTLRKRPIETLEEELSGYSKQRPMALILPSLYSELEGPALPKIVEHLKSATYISDVIIGLDDAGPAEFEKARLFFSPLPQQVHILWHNGKRLKTIDSELTREGLSPQQPGKGRNVWYCMGYALGISGCEAVALHDCDITTYDRYLPARLLYPVANPSFSFEFCKGYYPRIARDRLGGRVTRLFVTPLLRALKKILGAIHYLEFMDSFRYPLSGEFSLRKDLMKTLRIPGDWGLEIGVLSEVYRNLSRHQVCQVDIADAYDHKHQILSEENADTGLSRMSQEIAKSIYRKLATEGVDFSTGFFRTVKACYYRMALDCIEQYYFDSQINDLAFDRHLEEQCVEVFSQSIITAGDLFVNNPMETPFIPNWNRILSAVPDIGTRLVDSVSADNDG
jgi:glucosyl-3-phosphoglycerate synthase